MILDRLIKLEECKMDDHYDTELFYYRFIQKKYKHSSAVSGNLAVDKVLS